MLKSIAQKWLQALRLPERVRYKVVAINSESHMVTVYCRGRGATFKQALSELVKDNTILDYMPVSHLAWLGYSLSKYGSGGVYTI